MGKKVIIFLMAIYLGFQSWSQKTAEEYLKEAPIILDKDVCSYTQEEFTFFTDRLGSYNDSLFKDIEQRKQNSRMVDLSPANYQKTMEILDKVTKYSTDYMAKYYCLILLCKDYPELLSGDEISRATKYANKIKELIQFGMDVMLGKAKDSDRPGWRKEKMDAENGFCGIMGSKYIKVLENDLNDLKKLLPDYRTLGSIYYSGDSAGLEIEALSAVHNYLEKFRTNSFLGNMKVQFN